MTGILGLHYIKITMFKKNLWVNGILNIYKNRLIDYSINKENLSLDWKFNWCIFLNRAT